MNRINPLKAILMILFLGVGLNPVIAFAQTSQPNPKPKYQYPQQLVNAYVAGCTQRSIKEGLTQQQATSVCQCTINQFQSRYSADQFLKMYSQAQKAKEPPDEFVDIGLDCAERIKN